MSVFDLPRLHFGGTAGTHLPTGPRNGLADLATNTALTGDGQPVPIDRPPAEYHDHLDRLGSRLDCAGRPTQDGAFTAGKGPNFAGNGHFTVDARVLGVELTAGELDTGDPVVGRAVDMWGHYNEYLGTTVNRARVFDLDPASDRTTTLMVGRFSFGREGRSHDVGYLVTGDVTGFQPPRWLAFDPELPVGTDDPLPDGPAGALRRRPTPCSVVHQFVVPASAGLTWFEGAAASPAVARLREAVEVEGFAGLVVQFALLDPALPEAPDRPTHRRLRGTIAPWRAEESRTHPAGRLLVPTARAGLRPSPTGPHTLTVAVTRDHVTLNAITAFPAGPETDRHDLELRTAPGDRLVVRIPAGTLSSPDHERAGGVVTVPRTLPTDGTVEEEALLLVVRGAEGPRPVLREREIDVRVDESCLILDHPRDSEDSDHDVDVPVRSFVRGRPAAVTGIAVRQFFNPRALPRDPVAGSPRTRATDLEIVRMRAADGPGNGTGTADGWAGSCLITTDVAGRGRFTLRGARPGTTSLLLMPDPHEGAPDPYDPGSAARVHGMDDVAGSGLDLARVEVRVLPDDWRLASLGPEDADFDLVWREVFAWYEHLFSFMKAEVFSLADRCKVETYAKLIWQMCDPRNKAKTYYMPPTRDLSEPKARLLLHYLRARQRPDEVLNQAPATVPRRPAGTVTTRSRLLALLRDAAAVELAVMVQYLYAAWSIPTRGTGLEYVNRGLWTPDQLRLACGDGGETLDEGIRSTLLTIAREEMIHFLLVNNIITAIGEPFHIPRLDFATINQQLPVPIDFALERLGPGSLERFIRIEQPADLVDDVWRGERPPSGTPRDDRHPYGSLSELYAEIRDGLQRVPDLFLVDKGRGGGEHHLFLRESINAQHPDYQLQVDDLASALFAIDVIAEQGEGGVLGERLDEHSHYAAFLRVSDLLHTPPTAPPRPGRERWNPTYPVVRNPTLRAGNPALETVTDPDARAVMELFNDSYYMTLQLMAQHFGERPDASLRRSDLMNAAIDMMAGLMRPLAEVLVTLPSGRRGTTAGPSFELADQPAPIARPDVARRVIALRLDHLAAACAKNPLAPTRVGEMSAAWADHFRPRRA